MFLLQRDHLKYLQLINSKVQMAKPALWRATTNIKQIAAFLSHISVWQAKTEQLLSFQLYLIFLRMKAPATDSLSDLRELLIRPPKRQKSRVTSNQYKAWTWETVFDCDLFYDESTNRLMIEAKTNFAEGTFTDPPESRSNSGCAGPLLACAVLVDSSAYY